MYEERFHPGTAKPTAGANRASHKIRWALVFSIVTALLAANLVGCGGSNSQSGAPLRDPRTEEEKQLLNPNPQSNASPTHAAQFERANNHPLEESAWVSAHRGSPTTGFDFTAGHPWLRSQPVIFT